MTDVTRALEQIAEIHSQLAKSEIYRGWRSAPVAVSGAIGLVAAWCQSTWSRPIEPIAFVSFWLIVAIAAFAVGSAEIATHFFSRATPTERRRTRQVLGQFLPALVAGLLVTIALTQLNPVFVTVLPGLWALFFGTATFSARPYLPSSSGFIAAFYWTAGFVLLWTCRDAATLSPWAVGGTFGAGQLLTAAVLYWHVERGMTRGATTSRQD